jgi:FkbH-like protein
MTTLYERRLRWQAHKGSEDSLRIALLSTFTVEPLVPYLGTALLERGIGATIRVGPYNQVVPQCLDEASLVAELQPQVLIVWMELDDLWQGQPLPMGADHAERIEELVGMAETCLDAARRWRATLVFVLPAIPEVRPLGVGDACTRHGVFATAVRAREALRDRLAGQRGVLLADAEETVRDLGARDSYDLRLRAIAHVPFTERLFCGVADRIAALLSIAFGQAAKAVVVDGDNTLWGGVLGEDGPQGVDLAENGPGHAYRAFQAFLVQLSRAGVLVALCSKNDEADVWNVFGRPEMRLQQRDLACWRIGWANKSVMIREIADELGISLSSVVFIDDSPAELAEVAVGAPQVQCVRMPADPVEWQHVVRGRQVLDRLPPTAEDLTRVDSIKAERVRTEVRARSDSPEAYRASLGTEVRIFAVATEHLGRLAQLVGKTNQFNLNCRRRSEAELAGLLGDQSVIVRMVAARDRFGDYGVVGAYVAAHRDSSLSVDTFLLSCRALGRGIEEAMLADLFEEADRLAVREVRATVEHHPRNEPVRTFFARWGCATPGEQGTVARPRWPDYIARVGE